MADVELIGGEEDDVAIVCSGEFAELGLFFLADEFGDGAGHFTGTGFAAEFQVGEAFGTEFFGFFGEGVEGFSREGCAAAGDGDEVDAAAGFDGAFKDGGVGSFGPLGDILEFQAVAGVGAVDAEAAHGFGVAHAGDFGEVDVEDLFPEAFDEAGDEGDDVVGIDEGHFQVDLRELGLAVGAGVFVAEAAADLHVAVAAADHEDLLEELGGLGECVKAAGVETGGDEEFAGAFGGGFVEDGRFNFEEAVLVAVVAHDLGDAMARDQGFGHLLAANVQVAVLEAEVFVDRLALAGGEGGRIGFVDEGGGGDDDFDVASNHFGVGAAFFAGADGAGEGDDVLVAQGTADFVGGLGVGMKNGLGDAFAVAEIDKDDAAVVAVGVDPAGQGDLAADFGFSQNSAGMGALHRDSSRVAP